MFHWKLCGIQIGAMDYGIKITQKGCGTMKLSQIRLIVEDFHQSVAFYKEVMEFPLCVSAEEMQFASFNTGETKIENFSRQNMVEEIGEDKLIIGAQSPSKFLLALAVDQVDEVYARLREKVSY
jgi:lactoylglutathione lyase